MKKAVFIYNEKVKENVKTVTFAASAGWLQKVVRRNGLSLG